MHVLRLAGGEDFNLPLLPSWVSSGVDLTVSRTKRHTQSRLAGEGWIPHFALQFRCLRSLVLKFPAATYT